MEMKYKVLELAQKAWKKGIPLEDDERTLMIDWATEEASHGAIVEVYSVVQNEFQGYVYVAELDKNTVVVIDETDVIAPMLYVERGVSVKQAVKSLAGKTIVTEWW